MVQRYSARLTVYYVNEYGRLRSARNHRHLYRLLFSSRVSLVFLP